MTWRYGLVAQRNSEGKVVLMVCEVYPCRGGAGYCRARIGDLRALGRDDEREVIADLLRLPILDDTRGKGDKWRKPILKPDKGMSASAKRQLRKAGVTTPPRAGG